MRRKKRNRPRRWRARRGARFDDDQAQKIGERLEVLAERLGIPYVQLTTQQIMDDAYVRSSPLHVQVEWDDVTAASLYRKKQIRDVMNHLDIESVDEDGNVTRTKAFYNVRLKRSESESTDVEVEFDEDDWDEEAEPTRAYVDIDALTENPKFRRDFVEYCEQKMRHFAQFVRDFGETKRFKKILKAIDDYERGRKKK